MAGLSVRARLAEEALSLTSYELCVCVCECIVTICIEWSAMSGGIPAPAVHAESDNPHPHIK